MMRDIDEQRMQLYQQGLGDREMARRLGCCEMTIAKWRYRHGLKTIKNKEKSGRPIPLEEESERMYLYEQGLNDRQIAERCGLARTSVTDWRVRRGLEPNVPIGRPAGGFCK